MPKYCTECGQEMAWRPINLVLHDKLWRIEIPVCIIEECMIKREGTYVEYRTESRYQLQ